MEMDCWNSSIPREPDEVDELFAIKHSWISIVLALVYIWFAKIYGPKFMKNRQPYDMNTYIRIYNIVQVLCNGYVIATPFILDTQMLKDFVTYHCHYCNTPENVSYVPMAKIGIFILVTKYLDLLDSVFMVLKKKYDQLSFLHVYHHASVLILLSLMAMGRDGLCFFLGFLNSGVHVIMYFYYFLSSFKSMKKFINPYKPWITRVQIIQFFIMLAFMIYAHRYNCSMSIYMRYVMPFVVFTILLLFIQFYIQNYNKTDTKKVKSK